MAHGLCETPLVAVTPDALCTINIDRRSSVEMKGFFIMHSEIINSYFLYHDRDSENMLLDHAEKERSQILKDLKLYLTGNIDIKIYTVQHKNGKSIVGDLMVNGELCRSYDPIALCFGDLNTLMLNQIITARS